MRQQAAVGLTVLLSAAFAFAAADKSAAYADEVLQYDPNFGGQAPKRNMDPSRALGKPGAKDSDVSIGRGGLLELAFVDRVITNSGNSEPDILVHEVGPSVESTYVALQPADAETARAIGFRCRDERKPVGDGFCEMGRINGGTTGLDIDALFPGFAKGQLHFNAIQLMDDENQGDHKGPTAGADIDGVVALFPGPAAPTVWSSWMPARNPGSSTLLPSAATGHASTPSLTVPGLSTPTVGAVNTHGTPGVPKVTVPAAPVANPTHHWSTPNVGVVPRP